jgi:hypothetical protein
MSNSIEMADKNKKDTIRRKVEQLKASLPKDYSKLIEDKYNVTRRTISRVLNDFDTTHPIMGELVALAEQERSRRNDLESKIHKLLNE